MLVDGQVVGHIRLVARIGAGGMGEVWEGVDERLGRRVAVKAIRRSEQSNALARARFAREARILSQLEHPNVCRLYEFVETEELDVLVLELVRGRSLTQAIGTGLTRTERLDIALGTCSALLAAHSLSVVHRDLKPDNVMLAEDGTVKVLDFGIARRVLDGSVDSPEPGPTGAAQTEHDTAATVDVLTTHGQVVGTPRYMSPEQARGEPTTAASDMFSFGLLLYELYVGKPGYESASLQEALVRAQWGDVPKAAGVDRVISALIRDLTALEPQRRLTAEQALDRLQRLQQRPLRRVRTAAAAVAVVGLLAGTALSLLGLARARHEAAVAEATTGFLERLFQASDPQEAQSPDIKAREVLDRGVVRVRVELKDQPAIRARLLTALGGIYGNLSLNREAQTLLEEGLAEQERLSGKQDPTLIPALTGLANALVGQGDARRAEEVARRAVAIASREGLLTEEATTLNLLAALLERQGRLDEAETAARGSVAAWQKACGKDHPKTGAAMVNLALVEIDRGRYASAEAILTESLAILERHLPPDSPDIAKAVGNLATAYKELGRLAEAEALYRRSLSALQKRLGPNHPQCAVVENDLAVALLEQRRLAEAETAYRNAVVVMTAAAGPSHPLTAIFNANLAEACLLQGRPAEAEPLYRGALVVLRKTLGENDATVAETLKGLARTCAGLGRTGEAEALFLDSVRIREASSGPAHPEVGKTLTLLGVFYLDQGRADDAGRVLARATRILEPTLEPTHPARAELRAAVARVPGGVLSGVDERR